MVNKTILLDTAPECVPDKGLIYIVIDGKRVFAYPPHVARIANERMRRALDQFDRDNANTLVEFG